MVVLARRGQVTEAPAVVAVCTFDLCVAESDDDATWVSCGVDVATTAAKEQMTPVEHTERWGCRHLVPSTTQLGPDRAWEKSE